MKEAYVSFVYLPDKNMPDSEQIMVIDSILQKESRRHEIVIVLPFTSEEMIPEQYYQLSISGPISFVFTNSAINRNDGLIAGLGKAVGDFIFEWRGLIDDFSDDIFSNLTLRTNHGFELVELETSMTSISRKLFYRFVNIFRNRKIPINEITARVYSRRALGQVLSAINFENQVDILFAELPLRREVIVKKIRLGSQLSLVTRINLNLSLLIKGSKFGTIVPLLLAGVSALFGVGVSVYALTIYFAVGKSPEGWTTLMIVTGLGQASILALLGLLWSRIDSLGRNFSQTFDATSEVIVIPPKNNGTQR